MKGDGYVIGDHTDIPTGPHFNLPARFDVVPWELAAGAARHRDVKSLYPNASHREATPGWRS